MIENYIIKAFVHITNHVGFIEAFLSFKNTG